MECCSLCPHEPHEKMICLVLDKGVTCQCLSPTKPTAEDAARLRREYAPQNVQEGRWEALWRIELPYACFGVITDQASCTVIRAAPMGKWMIGHHVIRAEVYAMKKGGSATLIEEYWVDGGVASRDTPLGC